MVPDNGWISNFHLHSLVIPNITETYCIPLCQERKNASLVFMSGKCKCMRNLLCFTVVVIDNHDWSCSETAILLYVLRNTCHPSPVPSLHIRMPRIPAASSFRPSCRAGATGHETPGPASTETLLHHWMEQTHTHHSYKFIQVDCIVRIEEEIECEKWGGAVYGHSVTPPSAYLSLYCSSSWYSFSVSAQLYR